MLGTLKIVCPPFVVTKEPFQCVVHIHGAKPGERVRIRLWQTAGIEPFYGSEEDALITGDGSGAAIIDDVTLVGPCMAVLVADDVESSAALVMDDAHVKVTS